MPDLGLVVVTGGGRGIGAAICRRVAAMGHPVASYVTGSVVTVSGGR